ncbi:RecBCD enzyme subunit RecB [Tepidimonas alkaliphilus]|uniref:RecBCD enzyme subunit RecB n=1 Tax=Tepidimonas alkaliphilus TaxID=2588942 RepID=A0A554W4H3_9BURK|nr:exodeoxyribonuclease V subunit beta [Tepidimonas alkaliphilus]TSE18466.1 RecBCD enzyme subunit RecB [Tepidimonas alkaliphilus]
MSADLPQLDPLTLPLAGSQLIEASAGSGKTWTMALLAVRLVLGAPPEEAGLPPLSPRQILVVTFTDAATQELRSRIQARLLQAAAVFGGEALDPADAAVQRLLALRDRYPQTQWPALARRLTEAADALDEAPISTLHGWCQRILREQALLSGEPFAPRILQDTAALRREAVRDWWRLHVLPLDEADAAAVLEVWDSPDELDQAIKDLLEHAELWAAQDPGLPTRSLPDVAQQAEATRAQALAALKAPWPAWIDEAEKVLGQHGLLKHISTPHWVKTWLANLRTWAADPLDAKCPLTEKAIAKFTLEHLRTKGGPLPSEVETLPLLRELPELEARLAALPGAHGALTRHAAVWVAQRMRAQLRTAEQLTFDEMLRRVDEALAGPQGAALAQRLRQQQPVALVDEFQDTDPRQWRILQAIYRPEQPPPGTALLLIGDPKQAIYAFRHADIHSYLQARAACAGRIWSLAVNHRSSTAMVQAVNALFSHAERTLPDGAFGFARAGVQPVPFLPAQPHGQPERWRDDDDASGAALTFALWRPETEKLTRDDVRERLAAACAATVARWLKGSAAGRCGFERDGRLRPLQPQDLAILVNDGQEAQAIARALRRHGLASAYRSEKTSVWDGPEADDLQAWLHACAHPHDRDALAHALLTPALGLDAAALAALLHDEDAWDATLSRFARYHALWQRHGVLAAVRALMHDFGVAARLLARPADHPSPGARALADLLHMAEWLQQAARQRGRGGVEATLALLRLARQEGATPSSAGDDPTLTGVERRLDGTPQAIPVITVHKAKGLQFPLVLLPFAGRARPLTDKRNPPDVLRWHDDAGRAHVTLPDEGEPWLRALERAERERLLEDTRKLYVALTRAVHLTWVGVALEPGLASSALARLLGLQGADAATLAEQMPERLQALAQASGGTVACTRLPDDEAAPADRAIPHAAAPARPAVRAHVARPRGGPPWWIASYSALARAAHDAPASADAATEAHVGDDDPGGTGPEIAGPGEAPTAAPWHRWPRGAQPGVALHALLEACHRHGWPAGAPDALQPLAQRTLQGLGWAAERLPADAEDLAQWAHAIGDAALTLPGSPGVRLRDLTHAEPEVPFWLRIDAAAEARALDRLLLACVAPGQPRPALAAVTLHGMLKGFMDLVFEHDGRYWVLDHKSNALGPDDAAYHAAAVQAEVLRQRYDAQAALYLLALHRWLAQRLGRRYEPARHLGGALCVFWRGVAAPGAGVWHLAEPWPLVRRLEALFTGAEVTA